MVMPRPGVIALGGNGKQMASPSLAAGLGRARGQGVARAAFVIGAPDGFGARFFGLRFALALLRGDGMAASTGGSWPPKRFFGRWRYSPATLSSGLIRELAGVLPRRRHFPLQDGVMRFSPAASPTGRPHREISGGTSAARHDCFSGSGKPSHRACICACVLCVRLPCGAVRSARGARRGRERRGAERTPA
ncbi:MAG: hypothetical protein ACREDJ_06160 [Methylocella sp.]